MWQKHYSLHCQIERYPTTVRTHMVLLLTAVYTEIGLKKKKSELLKMNMVYLSENYICLFFFLKATVPWFKTNTKAELLYVTNFIRRSMVGK